MKSKIFFFILFFFTVINAFGQTGCLVPNYDAYNKVFNNPETLGGSIYLTGNGNNFVQWQGVCGPHQYIEVYGLTGRSCTLKNDLKSGTEYYISDVFPSPCDVPIDEYSWCLFLILGISGFYLIRKKSSNLSI